MQHLILIGKQDQAIGEASKVEAHLGEAKRHRAFTAILKNDRNEYLLTKRSLKKPLWPTFWDLSFSSHPFVGETLEQACERRAVEELGRGIKQFQPLFSYEYHIQWNEWFSEWEVNHILIARVLDEEGVDHDDTIFPAALEIAEWQWLSWEKVMKWLRIHKQEVAPWVLLAILKIEADPTLTRKIKEF